LNKTYLIFLSVILLVLSFINLSIGSQEIGFVEVLDILQNKDSNPTWSLIFWEYRIPKLLAAILAGAGLACSGLLMQTLFRNPLAGPYVLGISSGASFGVALFVMAGSSLACICHLSGIVCFRSEFCGTFRFLSYPFCNVLVLKETTFWIFRLNIRLDFRSNIGSLAKWP
jgi:ABC-type Fe3+-siderophore transport system permease subunit